MAHGHEPVLSEMILAAAGDPDLVARAKAIGAKGINVVGMCCTGNEIIMRHGIPLAGNFMQQELAVITGAVDSHDRRCSVYHAGPGRPFANAFTHGLFPPPTRPSFRGPCTCSSTEENALAIAKEIVGKAVENYSNRVPEKVFIPKEKSECMVGFSAEAIINALGGTLDPLLDAIKSGAIKGIAGVVGCNNPKIKHDEGHVKLVRELIKNDVLVVNTGCNAIATAKSGVDAARGSRRSGVMDSRVSVRRWGYRRCSTWGPVLTSAVSWWSAPPWPMHWAWISATCRWLVRHPSG